jgi:hypothetical protein
MKPGDHIKVWRGLYWHHGIYIGFGLVIHFTGLTGGKRGARVQLGSLADFEAGGRAVVVQYDRSHAPDDVVRRAYQLVGTAGYNVLSFNCESAARWCMTGEVKSEQVQRASTVVGGTGATVAASAALGVASAMVAPALSGAAQMTSTLAGVGGTILGGTAVLSAVPAAVAVAAFHHAMADDAALCARERAARTAGRRAALWSAAGAVGLGVLLVALGGAGLGAAGTASALKLFGAAVGGGMGAGITVIGGGAALAAAALGWSAYKRAGGGMEHLPLVPHRAY